MLRSQVMILYKYMYKISCLWNTHHLQADKKMDFPKIRLWKYLDFFCYGSVYLRPTRNQREKFSISIFIRTAVIKCCGKPSKCYIDSLSILCNRWPGIYWKTNKFRCTYREIIAQNHPKFNNITIMLILDQGGSGFQNCLIFLTPEIGWKNIIHASLNPIGLLKGIF